MNKKNITPYKSGQDIQVSTEETPHPQALKFTLNCQVASQVLEITSMNQAGRSPLAQKILGFPWVKKIFIGYDFMTVTKETWVDWDIVKDPLCQLIKDHIKNGEKVLHSLETSSSSQNDSKDEAFANLDSTKNSDPHFQIVQKIKQLLEKDIQPAVARDGGFIAFAGYKNGQVFLKMQGACSGCPSASLTLKQGIETHLKNHILEVKEVVAL